MGKAYDRVEWASTWNMMRLSGFSEKWIHMINMCLSSISFHILINGACSCAFHTIWGLCQGDPLSPYLFLMFWRVNEPSPKANANNKVGIPIARSASSLSPSWMMPKSLNKFLFVLHLNMTPSSSIMIRKTSIWLKVVANWLKWLLLPLRPPHLLWWVRCGRCCDFWKFRQSKKNSFGGYLSTSCKSLDFT